MTMSLRAAKPIRPTGTVANKLVNGEIANAGFDGDIDVALVFTPTGGSPTPLDPTLSNQTVINRFFGFTGDQATVVYESDFSVTACTNTISGNLAGATDAFDSRVSGTE